MILCNCTPAILNQIKLEIKILLIVSQAIFWAFTGHILHRSELTIAFYCIARFKFPENFSGNIALSLMESNSKSTLRRFETEYLETLASS